MGGGKGGGGLLGNERIPLIDFVSSVSSNFALPSSGVGPPSRNRRIFDKNKNKN